MNFQTSRYVKTEEPAVQFAVYFLRLNPLGARYSAGLAGFPPHSQAVAAPRTFTLSESAENAADALNARDLAGDVAA
jgi:hypothetical protein